jgi:hypothetical protein
VRYDSKSVDKTLKNLISEVSLISYGVWNIFTADRQKYYVQINVLNIGSDIFRLSLQEIIFHIK